MDASIFRELALWATAGGGGLVLGFKLIQKFSSGARAAIAADDKSVSLLDRLERQIKEQEEDALAVALSVRPSVPFPALSC